jgi:PAS domain S-box-containing protein
MTTARNGSGASPVATQPWWLGVPLAVGLMAALAVLDLSVGSNTELSGLMVVGPAVAALGAGPRAVIGVGMAAVGAILALAGPDNLWGEAELGYLLAAAVVITAVSAYMAHMREKLTVDASRLAAIVESSADPVVGKALDGTIVSWNAAAEEIFGWSAEEVLGRNINLMVPDDLRDELGEIMARAASGQAITHYITRRLTKDGRELDISVTTSPIRASDGSIIGVSALGRDVTEALRAADAMAESEARKSAILDGALDAVITIDHTGTVLEANPAMTATFGWTAEEMVGHPLAELIVPEEKRAAHREGIADYLRTGSSPQIGTRLQLTAVRKDGTRIPVEVTITRVDLPGDPVFTGYLRDMTTQHAAQAEADRLRERLAQAERLDSLGQLAGGIAHDFNNLLAVILNYAALARVDLPAGAVRDDLDAISAAAQRAAGLTRQLLTFSRGDQGQVAVLDPNTVAKDVCEVLRRTLPAMIDVVCNFEPDAWPVRCDTARLDQVLMNLAVNARDAMPDGGTLTIETNNVHLDDLNTGTRISLRPGRYLCLAVSDTGTGMSREVRERAFDPFFTTKPRGQGTGLGLASVYGIARQMEGEVSIYSELGSGTTVRLHLPVADSEVSDSHVVRAPAPAPHGRRVLLVEDEELLRQALDRTLSEAGFVVTAAESAEKALGRLDDGELPDLLVSDVSLPGMPGPELALLLRERAPRLPVLLMSGYAAHPLPAGLVGKAAMIDKPFPTRELLAQIAALLADGSPSSK